jgi:hypothetical protein
MSHSVVFVFCSMRILLRSLANARDVGEWLGASGHATFNFAPGVRPVPLEIHMHGLDIHNFEARMQVRVGLISGRIVGCLLGMRSASTQVKWELNPPRRHLGCLGDAHGRPCVLNPKPQASEPCHLLCCPQAMMRPCYSAILTHATPDKPAIVFVPTRKHVRLTAVDLLTSAAADGNPHRCVQEGFGGFGAFWDNMQHRTRPRGQLAS